MIVMILILILVLDRKEPDLKALEEIEELGIKFKCTNCEDKYLDSSYDLVIKNPGIRYDHPLILKANDLNIFGMEPLQRVNFNEKLALLSQKKKCLLPNDDRLKNQ